MLSYYIRLPVHPLLLSWQLCTQKTSAEPPVVEAVTLLACGPRADSSTWQQGPAPNWEQEQTGVVLQDTYPLSTELCNAVVLITFPVDVAEVVL